MTAVKNQAKKDILPESPNLAPMIAATNGGIITDSNDRSITKLNIENSRIADIKVIPGVPIIGENRVETTKRISSSGNPGGAIKIDTTRKTAFNPR